MKKNNETVEVDDSVYLVVVKPINADFFTSYIRTTTGWYVSMTTGRDVGDLER